ncbi:hypothetical protein [Gilvimarinus algae]|uniref:Uncharacterized protein n=1 Tax=Gilvimarinus algae TaxID=3058037 RepID=A0ABT8TH61_9GAMM|nr:hypothetical protein [Gilvimarinus sp. SDUM040014]MDO3383434.1 hypothetical protein [Gilvimarinus sp. SDUM040014]
MTARLAPILSDLDVSRSAQPVTIEELAHRQLNKTEPRLFAELNNAVNTYPYTVILEWPGSVVCIASRHNFDISGLPPGVIVGAHHCGKIVYVWE